MTREIRLENIIDEASLQNLNNFVVDHKEDLKNDKELTESERRKISRLIFREG